MKPYYKNELTTLYNGDCLEVMDYLIEQGVKVDAIITDPPYGTTACSWDNVIPFDKMWERLKLLRNDKTPIVLFGSEPFSSHLRMSNIKEFKYDWIWEKEKGVGFQIAKYRPMQKHEVISVFGVGAINYYPIMEERDRPYTRKGCIGDANKTNGGVSPIAKETIQDRTYTHKYPHSIKFYYRDNDSYHPTQKPLELMKYLIETYTKKGDLILDFTSGSFTTCVASDQLVRRSIGIELEKKYCDVGVKRLSQLQMRLDI
jgi:site-specific DNA-methyltransferase (adenine-specific)